MRTGLVLVAAAALVVSLGCRSHASPKVYGPWEEGLTLAFENPSQPEPQRYQDRFQIRVARARMDPGKPSLIQLDMTSSRGQLSVLVRHQDGGVAMVTEDGRVLSQPLPPGFPAAPEWKNGDWTCRVVGRATWEGATLLPATSDPVGVWVEARSASAPARRTLYLPNLGEVESREEQKGAWVPVNRLVARGFSDLPALNRP